MILALCSRAWQGTSQPHSAQDSAAGVGWYCGFHSRLWSGRTRPCCLGSRIYILPFREVYFWGSNPSCHCINMAGFLTLLFLPAAVILVGPDYCITPESQVGASEGIGSWCSSPSHQPVPVVKTPGLLIIPLGGVPNSGTWLLCWNGHGVFQLRTVNSLLGSFNHNGEKCLNGSVTCKLS